MDANQRSTKRSTIAAVNDSAGGSDRYAAAVYRFLTNAREQESKIGLTGSTEFIFWVPDFLSCLSRPHRVSVTGAGEDVSDGEGVVATFFLIRYQSIVASRTDINFARQFSRVSLANRTEGNFARQFFKIGLFIIAVQQNFRNALTKRLRGEIALNSPPMANGNAARLFGDNYRLVVSRETLGCGTDFSPADCGRRE